MGEKEQFSIYLPPELKRMAHAEAVRRGLTLSEAVSQALEHWLIRGRGDD